MDKLVKRAGAAMLIVIATAGSAFAWGMAHSAQRDRATPRLKLEAALKSSKLTLRTVVAAAKPAASTLLVAERNLPRTSQKAAGKPRPPAVRLQTPDLLPPEAREEAEPRADDLLDFGPGASERSEREAKLADRDAQAFGARQPGGAEQQWKPIRTGEHVIFETDLARPGDR